MTQFKSISIRKKLIALMIIMAAVPFAYMVVSLSIQHDKQEKSAIQSMVVYTEQISVLIRQITSSTELVLNTLSRLPQVQEGDEEAVNAVLVDMVRQYPLLSSIFLVDRDGERWATTNKTSGSVTYSDRRYFINAISSGRLSSGEYVIGKVKKKPVFSFGLPVQNTSGAITGVVVATIELSGLKQSIENKLFKHDYSTVLLDHKGTVLLHATHPEFEGKQEQSDVFSRLRDGAEQGVIEVKGHGNSRNVIVSYKKLSLPGEPSPYMYLLVEVDKSRLLKNANQHFLTNLAVLLASVIAALFILFKFSERYLIDMVDQSEQRYLSLFETSPQGIVYHDAHGTIISINQKAEEILTRLFGNPDCLEYPGPHIRCAHEDGTRCPSAASPSIEALSTGKNVSDRVISVSNLQDASCTWLKINAIPLFRKNEDKPYMVYSMFEDITGQRKQERERFEVEKKYQQSQRMESLGVLAGGIAHDFNNILMIIQGHANILKRSPLSVEKHSALIEVAVERGAELCRRMLAYAGKSEYSKAPVDIGLLVDDMIEMLRHSLNMNVQIRWQCPADIPNIVADAAQIRQIVMNLVMNASEAIGESQGEIRIDLCRARFSEDSTEREVGGNLIDPGHYICLEISDNGCGMDAATQQRIFEPFFTTKFTGRGLGMSAILGIVKAHEGAIQLISKPGEGSSFKVYFPFQAGMENGVHHEREASAFAIHWSGTILLVEDEAEIAETTQFMLEELGFNVIKALDGKSAITLFQKYISEISLVLTDINMPVMDGFELIEGLRQYNPDIPVIVSTGFGDVEISSRITLDEMTRLILKPYTFDKLEETLNTVLGVRKAVENC